MNLWIYLYPLPALCFFYTHWSKLEGSNFALFLIFAPVLYGYIMPGIAVNVLKKWKFNTKFRLGDYYAHHGFKISANINTSFFLTSYAVSLNNLSLAQKVTLVISTACVQGFIIWWHDTILIKLGKLELKNVLVNDRMSPEEKAYAYAPVSFSIMGASFATSALFALEYLTEHAQVSSLELILVVVAGFVGISLPATIAFGALESIARRKPKV